MLPAPVIEIGHAKASLNTNQLAIARKKIDLEHLSEKIVDDILTLTVTKGDPGVDWRNVEAINRRIRDAVLHQRMDEAQFLSHVKNCISAARPTMKLSMAAREYIDMLDKQVHYLDEARGLLHDNDPEKVQHLRNLIAKILQCVLEEEENLKLDGRKSPEYLKALAGEAFPDERFLLKHAA